jgi:hypothetical protein
MTGRESISGVVARRARWVALPVLIGFALVLGAPGAGAAAKVPAATYVANVCSAIATEHTDSGAPKAAVATAAQAYAANPGPQGATQLRHALTAYLQSVQQSFRALATSIRSAGVPDTPDGARFAKALLRDARRAVAQVRPILARARRIRVASAANFAHDFQELSASVQSIGDRNKREALADPAITRASVVFQPIVGFLTTDAATCSAA